MGTLTSQIANFAIYGVWYIPHIGKPVDNSYLVEPPKVDSVERTLILLILVAVLVPLLSGSRDPRFNATRKKILKFVCLAGSCVMALEFWQQLMS